MDCGWVGDGGLMDIYQFGLTFLIVAVVMILLSFSYLVDIDKLVRRIERLEERDEQNQSQS